MFRTVNFSKCSWNLQSLHFLYYTPNNTIRPHFDSGCQALENAPIPDPRTNVTILGDSRVCSMSDPRVEDTTLSYETDASAFTYILFRVIFLPRECLLMLTITSKPWTSSEHPHHPSALIFF